MPDITMCSGDGCKIKESCYRHTAFPNPYRQSFFAESPGDDKSCEYYIPDRGENKVKKVK